jgi:hypothetical protein
MAVPQPDHEPKVIGIRAIRDLQQPEVAGAVTSQAVGLRDDMEPRTL